MNCWITSAQELLHSTLVVGIAEHQKRQREEAFQTMIPSKSESFKTTLVQRIAQHDLGLVTFYNGTKRRRHRRQRRRRRHRR